MTPRILSLSFDVDFNIAYFGDDVTLMCSSDGGPDNNYEWSKDGVVLSGETNDSLMLSPIVGAYGGDYTCLVSNAAGNDSNFTTLYVAPYVNPANLLDEKTLTANGSNVNILCDVEGFPNPSVTWVDMTNLKVSNTSLLQFSQVLFGDEGVYRCDATVEITGTDFNVTYVTILTGRLVIVVYMFYFHDCTLIETSRLINCTPIYL